MTITITDKSANPLLVIDGQTLNAYKGATVADTAPLSSSEMVTIKLSQTLTTNGYPGPNFYFSPTSVDLGTITDPNGGGSFDPTTETFTESGVISGDPTFATALLSRLIYNAPALPNGQGLAEQASITVTDGTASATDATPIIVGDVSPPAIVGTVANEPIASGNAIRPFATASITNPNFSYDYYTIVAGYPYNTYAYGPNYYYSPKNTAFITITDGGKATDADGLLTGAGLSKTGVGTYSLGTAYQYNLGYELSNLSFQTASVVPGQTSNPSFELDVTDNTSNLAAKDTITSLLVIGPSAPPVLPSIAGTQARQTVAPGNVISPFASVTISDANSQPTDTITITLMDAGGNATDAHGVLGSAPGLAETAAGSGVYTLVASDPSTLTTELDHLSFSPTPLPSGQTSVTTNFKVDVTNTGVNKTATDTTTSVTDTQPLILNPDNPVPATNFVVRDETSGKVYQTAGDPYKGPVAGITSEIVIATTDNINIDAQTPNVFIHSGSGEDGLNVSAVNGNNILDGSTGSNFLIGGTGDDTFYLDDRAPTSPVFSSIVGFHSGDNATVFGVTAQDFAVIKLNDQGAPGYTGLDLIFTATGHVDTSFVLAGYSSADLTNGRLSMSYGTTQSLPGAPGANYLTVHAT